MTEEEFQSNCEAIQQNAEVVVKQFASQLDVELGYNLDAVKWLDGYIQRNRLEIKEKTRDKLINIFGSFLGECLKKEFGGNWTFSENGFGIEFPDKTTAFPFNKVEKQFLNGSGDSIYSFFTAIPFIMVNLSKKTQDQD